MLKSILLLGGARSGKSRYAMELAATMATRVLFVATATAGDDDMRRRIEKHKQERQSNWQTLEATTDIGSRITASAGHFDLIIIDCITLLVNNIFSLYEEDQFDRIADADLEKQVNAEIQELLMCMDNHEASFILISNEVGLGLVPANRMGRLYRDILGRANQRLAQAVDEVYLMVAGLPCRVKPVSIS